MPDAEVESAWEGERLRRLLAHRATPYALAFVLQAAIAPFFIHDWDGFVFLTTVQQFLDGTTPYALAEQAPDYIFLNEQWPSPNSWFAYPPLALLLLTPGVALASLLGASDPAVLRLALKLPLIAGHLLLAYAGGVAVRDLGGSPRAVRLAELALLFNPFLIFITAAWGMFDATMMALLITSALLLPRRRFVLAGLAFAGAALLKPFPLFISPIFLIWALRTSTRREAFRFVASAVAGFVALSLPFLVGAPRGFVQQTLLMHLERPLQGFPLVGSLYLPRFTEARFGVPLWPLPPDWVGPALAGALLVPALALAFAYAASRHADLRHLLVSATVGIIVVLATSKVVNEQYLVMPVAMLTILALAPGATRLERWALVAWSAGGLVAGLLLGFHWLTFIPHDVAPYLLGMGPAEALHGIGLWAHVVLGIHPDVFYVLPDVLSVLAVVPAFVLGLRWVAPALAEGARRLRDSLHTTTRISARSAAAVLVILMLSAPTTLIALSADEHATAEPLPPLGERLVGATYYVWWSNPTHDPETRGGNWGPASMVPLEGYHQTNGHRMARDIDEMKEVGIDFAAVSYHGYDHGRYERFGSIARDKGFRFAPLVEAGEVLAAPAHQTLSEDPRTPITLRPTDETADAVAELVRRALKPAGNEAFLRFEGRPVVFVHDAHLIGISWDEGSKRALAEAVVANHDGSFERVADAWGVPVASLSDVEARFPADLDEFEDTTPIAADWRAAVEARQEVFWERIRAAAPEPIHVVATTRNHLEEMRAEAPFWTRASAAGPDATFQPAPANAYLRLPGQPTAGAVLQGLDDHQTLGKLRGQSFAGVSYAYDDTLLRPEHVSTVIPPTGVAEGESTYDRMWTRAIEGGHDHVLLASWNNFFEGTALHPTREHGRAPLDATAAWIERFKAGPRPEAPRVLAFVNEMGGMPQEPGARKDWTFSLSLQLPWKLAQAMPHAEVEVRDLSQGWDAPFEDLLRYDAIWVETGSGRFAAPPDTIQRAHDALQFYVYNGGSLVMLGGGLPKPFEDAYLADGHGNVHADPVWVEWDDGRASFPDTDRYVAVTPHAGCTTVATFEASGTAAAWQCPLGEGSFLGTAFRPQGWDYLEMRGADAAMRHLVLVSASDGRQGDVGDGEP